MEALIAALLMGNTPSAKKDNTIFGIFFLISFVFSAIFAKVALVIIPISVITFFSTEKLYNFSHYLKSKKFKVASHWTYLLNFSIHFAGVAAVIGLVFHILIITIWKAVL